MSQQLSSPAFMSLINGLTKETKILIDNSAETDALKQDFSLLAPATMTTEWDEKFASTIGLGGVEKTPEGANVGKQETASGFTTILSPEKRTTSMTYSYEYYKGKQDATQKIMEEYANNVKRATKQMWYEMNKSVFAMLNNGFTTQLSPDGEAVFSANHSFESAGSYTFNNLLDNVAPSLDVLKEVRKRAGDFKSPDGVMPLDPKKIMVKAGSTAAFAWHQILQGEGYSPRNLVGTTGADGNDGTRWNYGLYEIIETPFLESNTAYFFLEDYQNSVLTNPFYLGVHEMPTIFDMGMGGVDWNYSNLTAQITMVSLYKEGLINVPIGVYGSVGA